MGLSNFLKSARQKLLEVLLGRRSEKQAAIQVYATLSRFIFDKRHFSASRRQVKPPAFVPYPHNRVSAFWIDRLSETYIWQLGDEVAGKPRNKAVIARADFESAAAAGLGLTIEPDPAPHPSHVDICGWPAEKDEQKLLALDLCAKSLLRIR